MASAAGGPGGAPLAAVRSRVAGGEPLESVAADYEVPIDDIAESLHAIWPATRAA